MKKIIIALSVVFVVLFHSVIVYADDYNLAVEPLNDIIYDYLGSYVNASRLDVICDRWQSRGDDYCLFALSEGANYCTFIITDDYSVGSIVDDLDGFDIITGLTIRHWDSYIYRFDTSTVSQNLNQTQTVNFGTNQQCVELGSYSEFLNSFAEYYYDATIPKPNFSVFVNNTPVWSVPPTTETNYFSFAFDDSSTYKIEVGYKYFSPSYIKIGLYNGNVIYEPITYYTSPYVQAYEGNASNVSFIVNNIDFQWDAYITDNSSEFFGTSVPIWQNTWSNQAYNKARQQWIDRYSLCMPLYGNKIQIMARYYIESGNDVYVGPWQVWNSTYPSEYTEELPSNYQTGNYMPGISGQINQLETPDEILTVGEVTGPIGTGTTVTVNQVVPNYPNYPTIASYNHDSVLTTFITTASQLPSTFSGFSQFLTSAFGFIPSSIWAVISFGLTCCIVVMIIKIL